VYAPEMGIVSDAKEALLDLSEMDLQADWSAWAEKCKQSFDQVSQLPAENDRIINEDVIHAMLVKLPRDTVITNDAGNFATWLHTYYSFNEKDTYIGPTSGAMGYALPAALGAKLAYPKQKVLALAGDGGFMMTVQELETAVRYDIPVLVIVFNNAMYGTIRMHQEMHYPEKVIGTDLGSVSFKDLAESVGADGYLVKTADQFAEVFDAALQKNVPAVIEIMAEKEHISVSSTIAQIRNRAKK